MQRVQKTAPPQTLEQLRLPERIKQPTRGYTLESDVNAPFQRAKITGVFAGLVGLVLVGSITFVLQLAWDVALGITVTAGLFIGLITAMGWWVWDTGRALQTIYKLENAWGVDLSGDGYRGVPPKVQALLVNPLQGQATQRKIQRDNGQRAFANFVRGCFENNTTASTFWVREGRISQKQYEEFRDAVCNAGYAYRKHGGRTAGWAWNEGLSAESIIEMALRGNNESSTESPTSED
jgi:hypothetical protein